MGAKAVLGLAVAGLVLVVLALSRDTVERGEPARASSVDDGTTEPEPSVLQDPGAAQVERAPLATPVPSGAAATHRPEPHAPSKSWHGWVTREEEPSLRPPATGDLWLSARVATPDGRPLADFPVALDTYCARGCTDESVRVTTDSLGAFRARIPAPLPHPPFPRSHTGLLGSIVLLTIAPKGELGLRRELELDWDAGDVDLGVLSLPLGGSVRGVASDVVLRAPSDWYVTITPRDPGVAALRPRKSVSATPDAAGAFEASGISAGPALLRVHHRELGTLEELALDVAEGGSATVRLDYAGGDPERILVVVVRSSAPLVEGELVLRDPRRHEPAARRLEANRFAFLDLLPVEHELRLELSGREPRVLSGLLPGSVVVVEPPRRAASVSAESRK